MHRFPKNWYRRTSKRNIRKEIARQERKVARMRALRQQINKAKKTAGKEFDEQKAAARNPEIRYYIGITQNCPVSVLSLSQPSPDGTPGVDPLRKVSLIYVARIRD